MVYRITMLYNTIQYSTMLYWHGVNEPYAFYSICSIQFVQFNSICSICSIQLFNSIQFAIASNLGDKQWYTPYMCM